MRGSGTADRAWSRPIDSVAPSDSDGRPASATALSRADGEDELAGTGLSLVIDGFNHLQITTRPVPALNSQLKRSLPDFAAALAWGVPGARQRVFSNASARSPSAPCENSGNCY